MKRVLRALLRWIALLAVGVSGVWAATPSVSLERTEGSSGRVALVGRSPGGAIDPRFGTAGRVLIEGMTPRSVATDAMGRLVVIGTSLGSPPQPMLQRFVSSGHLDPSFGDRGTSLPVPVSGAAHALEGLVLGDGRTLVLGQLDDDGVPRPALWFVDAGGRFEPDWLAWTDTPSAIALSLTRASGESVMVALGVPRTPAGALEGFIYVPTRDAGSMPERLVQTPLPRTWGSVARLERSEKGQWRWTDPERTDRTPLPATASYETDDRPLWAWRKGHPRSQAAVAVTTPPSPSAGEAGAAIFTPFADSRPAQAPRHGDAGASGGRDLAAVGWGLVGALAAALAVMALRRRLAG